MSKSRDRFYAELKAQQVMDQLREEIPEYNLNERFFTIRDGIHEQEISLEAFIIARYTDVIEELIKAINGLLQAGDALAKRADE